MVTGTVESLDGTHTVCSMVTGTLESLAGTHTVMQHAYCHLNCAVHWFDALSAVQQPGCGQSLAVCCCELTKHKYQHRSATLSLMSCGKSHLVFLTVCSVSVMTHALVFLISCQVTSCLLWLWTRTCSPWPTGQLLQWSRNFYCYKHNEGMKENLGFNSLWTAE